VKKLEENKRKEIVVGVVTKKSPIVAGENKMRKMNAVEGVIQNPALPIPPLIGAVEALIAVVDSVVVILVVVVPAPIGD
jgi:hypothetical protein